MVQVRKVLWLGLVAGAAGVGLLDEAAHGRPRGG